jgi:3-hydroxyacyl-CoA dehydrogenase
VTTKNIRRAAVLGAGVMGSGIAAHLASCGIPTLLLDIVPRDLSDTDKTKPGMRNRFASEGLKAALKSKPNVFVQKDASSIIEVGNFEDDMHKLKDVDWIIEVVVENLAIKQTLFAQVEAHLTPGTIVSSNTSGLSIDAMCEGRSEAFVTHFLGTHFFNPVRYMHLLEIIPGPKTLPNVLDSMSHFVRRILGKGVVNAKDTTNFIANRIGVHGMMTTIHSMEELNYTVEEVDAIVGRPMGRPKSAAFGTADIVGLDTFLHVAKNCYDSLADDPERDVFKSPESITKMVEMGLKGRKAGGGFYKKEGRDLFAIDTKTLEYRPKVKPDFPELKAARKAGSDVGSRLKALINSEGRAADFAWHVLSRSLAYTANIAFDIADDIVNIDRAMRWGFNWELGPFEAWEAIGVKEAADRMRADGFTLPSWIDDAIASGGFYTEENASFFHAGKQTPVPHIPGSLKLSPLKASGGVVEKNRGATLVDMGDGIACVEFHTKMNTVDADLATMLNTACDRVEKDFDGLVLANEAEHFSAGANLMVVAMYAAQKNWDAIDVMIKGFQDALQRLTYLSKPVVANPHGLTLGGGCEMAMAADRMLVAQECYMGLVEVGVGLIPGGCGTLNLLKRMLRPIPAKSNVDRFPFIQRVFENIGMAKVATGAGEVFNFGFATERDAIAMNRDTRIADAKRLARYMADQGYTPSRPADYLVLPGSAGAAAIDLFVYGMKLSGHASDHDHLIAQKLAHVLCGGDTDGRTAVTEEHVLDLEREAFLSLVGEEKSIARIQHMLMKNKPLRN